MKNTCKKLVQDHKVLHFSKLVNLILMLCLFVNLFILAFYLGKKEKVKEKA